MQGRRAEDQELTGHRALAAAVLRSTLEDLCLELDVDNSPERQQRKADACRFVDDETSDLLHYVACLELPEAVEQGVWHRLFDGLERSRPWYDRYRQRAQTGVTE